MEPSVQFNPKLFVIFKMPVSTQGGILPILKKYILISFSDVHSMICLNSFLTAAARGRGGNGGVGYAPSPQPTILLWERSGESLG